MIYFVLTYIDFQYLFYFENLWISKVFGSNQNEERIESNLNGKMASPVIKHTRHSQTESSKLAIVHIVRAFIFENLCNFHLEKKVDLQNRYNFQKLKPRVYLAQQNKHIDKAHFCHQTMRLILGFIPHHTWFKSLVQHH